MHLTLALLLPLQSGTALCSPRAHAAPPQTHPRESLGAHSQAGLIPSWMHPPHIGPQGVWAEAVLWESPSQKKKQSSRKATCARMSPLVAHSNGQGLPVPNAAGPALRRMLKVSVPSMGRGFLVLSPLE